MKRKFLYTAKQRIIPSIRSLFEQIFSAKKKDIAFHCILSRFFVALVFIGFSRGFSTRVREQLKHFTNTRAELHGTHHAHASICIRGEMKAAILNVEIAIMTYGSIVQYCIISSMHAVYKLVGIVRPNLLHDHSAPPST